KWAWTLKRFSFEVTLRETLRPPRFSLQFVIPAAVAAISPVVKMSCMVDGQSAGTQSYSGTDEKYFEAELPAGVDASKPMRFEFAVEHGLDASVDGRDLGVIMPFNGLIRGISEKINFWLY
ncbi:MAG: hypothetical protein M3O20_11585, partial [Acidobacteriota bacterium]|nr:hypothetical protein [Acidobacteriota bacterium]